MVKKEPKIIISESRLAKTFKFSERKVRDYFKDARIAPAKYNFFQCLDIFIEKVQGNDEKEEHIKAQKELIKMKLEVLKGEYVFKEDVSEMISEVIAVFKNKLLSLPKKIKAAIKVSDERKHEEIIKKYILEALGELREYEELEKNVRSKRTNKSNN